MIKVGWEGVSQFSVTLFSSHSAEKFPKETFHCCTVFGYRKHLFIKGVTSRSSVDLSCVEVRKTFVEEPLCAVFLKFSVSETFWIRGGGINILPSDLCCLIVPKLLVVESFVVSLISGVMSRPCVEIFCLAVSEDFLGNNSVLCFRKMPIAKKFLDNRGGGGDDQNFSVGNLSHSSETSPSGIF